MSSIKINYNDIDYKITPNLNETATYATNANNIYNNCSVPIDFENRSDFFAYANDMGALKKDIDSFNTWLKDSIKKEKDIENRSYNYANTLPNNRVLARKSMLK